MTKKKTRLEQGLSDLIDGKKNAPTEIFEEINSKKEVSQLDYLLCMEEFLDDCHVYAFKGWDKAVIASMPEIGKFWFTCDIFLPMDTDFRAVSRIKGKNSENSILYREDGDKYIVRLKILRRILDSITEKNKAYAEKNANIGPYAEKNEEQNEPEIPTELGPNTGIRP